MVDFIFEENKSFLHSSLIRRYSVSPNPDRDLELDKDAVSILFVKPHGTLLEGEWDRNKMLDCSYPLIPCFNVRSVQQQTGDKTVQHATDDGQRNADLIMHVYLGPLSSPFPLLG